MRFCGASTHAAAQSREGNRINDVSRERISRIERIELHSPRTRDIGCNARSGAHGIVVQDPVVRVHGAVGVGWARLERDGAEALVGRRFGELFQLPEGALADGVAIDLPLWDRAAKLEGVPLYRLLGARGYRAVELYDGSVYIDDLDADSPRAEPGGAASTRSLRRAPRALPSSSSEM